jgi:hypothetical protein
VSVSSSVELSSVPRDRLFRVGPEVYQGMVEHGLLPVDRKVVLVGGFLVEEETEQLHPLTLEVYYGMVEHGLLTADDKIELLDGLMVEKMTKGDPHETATLLVRDALQALALPGWHVRTEAAIALPAGPTGRPSVPEPDVSFARGGIRDYRARKPSPADLALIAEVADSTLRKDRARLVRYAWSKIPIVWLVNLPDGCVEVYTEPTGPAGPAKYNAMTVYGSGDRIPGMIDGREVGEVAVKDILP